MSTYLNIVNLKSYSRVSSYEERCNWHTYNNFFRLQIVSKNPNALLLLSLGWSEDGDEEVDGGAAGDEGRHCHNHWRVLAVTNRDTHLDYQVKAL